MTASHSPKRGKRRAAKPRAIAPGPVSARTKALAAANDLLVDLYWQVGEYISRKVESAAWGKGTVAGLAAYIQRRHPALVGFSASNLWRMRQFLGTPNRQMGSLISSLQQHRKIIAIRAAGEWKP